MGSAVLYLLTVAILSQNNRRLPSIVADIASVLNDSTADVNVLYTFKVVGEAKVIVVVRGQNNTAIDRLVNKLLNVGKLEINSQPLITYEKFAENLGVSDNLTQPVGNILERENLYWVTFNVDYNNKTTDELLIIWKSEAEALLGSRANGAFLVIAYKYFTQRAVAAFLTAPVADQFDFDLFSFPLVKEIGSDIHIEAKGIQFLDDYK